MAFSKSVNLAHAQTAVPCSICEDEPPGEYYCIECKQTLCPQCEKNHRRVAATKNHNIVLRTQIGDIDTTSLTCSDHGDHASFHCEKCNLPVCGKCITGKHREHALSDLADIFDREKEVLQNNVTRMREILSKLKQEREELITGKSKYDTKIQKITKDLEAENQAAHEELDRIHYGKMKDLASIQARDSSIFDGYTTEVKNKIVIFEARINEFQKVLGKNSLSAVINLSKRKESLPEFENKPELPKPPDFTPGEIQNLVKILGKLQFSSDSVMEKQRGKPSLKLTTPAIVSKFQCPLQGLYPSICITKEGDVWLGGLESRELVIVNIKGQVLRRRKIQNRLFSLAVMDCGDVIISPRGGDSRSVSRLLRDGREQQVYDTSPSCIVGVSVTADQKILICTYDGRVVRINSDGTNVKEIYKGSGDHSAIHAVENSDGNIYIGDYINSSVVMISKDGQVLSRIKQTEDRQPISRPLGLVVDNLGNTLCSDQERHVVNIINQKQHMKELIGKTFGLQKPQWMAVDNDNNLWITQRDGTILVVKYAT